MELVADRSRIDRWCNIVFSLCYMIRVENGWCGGEMLKFNAVSWLSEVDLSLVTIAGQGCEVGWPYRTHRNERRQRPVLFPLPRISTFTSVGPLLLRAGDKLSSTKHRRGYPTTISTASSMREERSTCLVRIVGEGVGGEKRRTSNSNNNFGIISSSSIGAVTQ